MTLNETINTQSKKSRLPIYIGIGCGVIFLCILGCVGFYFFFIRGVSGEPANTDTIERVTLEFINALHDNQIVVAHEMLSEKVRDSISINDLEILSKTDPIESFKSLNVCEFQIIWGSFGKQPIGYGVLRFSDSEVIFESSLLQDSDGKWRIGGFYPRPDLTATPSNACTITQP